MKKLLILALFFANYAHAQVTLPYTFSAGNQVRASELNADLSAVTSGLNSHINNSNGHNTKLSDVVGVNASLTTTPINFNLLQGLSFRIENVSSDPSCGSPSIGRIVYNTTDSLLKFCDGSSYVSIAGSGVNTLASVLSAGNSAGSSDLNLNGNQLLGARVENLSADPSPGSAGRLFYNTTGNALKLDTGSAITPIGGSQGLSSVLGISNGAGSSNIDFNGNQAVNMRLEQLASNPGTTAAGRVYYNTSSNLPFFYNGSSWVQVGNTNSLAQSMAIGNSVGSSNLDMNGKQFINSLMENLSAPPGTGQTGRFYYDTVTDQVGYEGPSSNHYVCSLDDAQTLTNKTISGSSNTITNIPDSALSANVDLLDGAQTISAEKVFSAAPQISRIKASGTSGSGHLVPDLSDDTFTLNNAVQTLAGKTLQSPTLSGNLDFAEYQAAHMRLENLASSPAPGNAGRIFYKTTTGEIILDTGSSLVALTLSPGNNLASVLSNGNSASIYDIDLNDNQILNARVENLASLPAFGNVGRIVFNTGDGTLYVDSGTAWNPAGGGAAVTSVGLAMPAEFTVSNSPVTSTGSLTADWATEAANKVFAGPVSGVAATPAFRSLVGADLPAPSSSTLGGVQSAAPVSSRWINSISTSGVPALSQPAFSDISGTVAASQLPNPSLTTLGGVEAIASVSHEWINSISTSGVPALSQPDFSDLTGTATIGQGGTGQTSKTAAFDALSPNTTKGDITVFNGTNNVRIGVGSDGDILTADSAQADGVKWAPASAGGALAESGTRGSPNNITAAGGITSGAGQRQHQYIQGSGGAVTVTANPQISAGTILGQELILQGRSDTNTVTLADGTGLSLNGPITMGADSVLSLIWDGNSWVETSRRQ